MSHHHKKNMSLIIQKNVSLSISLKYLASFVREGDYQLFYVIHKPKWTTKNSQKETKDLAS